MLHFEMISFLIFDAACSPFWLALVISMPCPTRCLTHFLHVTTIFIRILVCDTLTVLRCDWMPFFTRGQGKIFRDPIGGKCLSVMDMFHLTQSSHSFPDSHHRPMYFPPKYKIARLLFGRRESCYFKRSFHSYPGGGCNLYEARSSQKLRFLIMKVFCLHIRSMNLKANSG